MEIEEPNYNCPKHGVIQAVLDVKLSEPGKEPSQDKFCVRCVRELLLANCERVA